MGIALLPDFFDLTTQQKFSLMETTRLETAPELTQPAATDCLVFKPITLNSLSEIAPYLPQQSYRTCDFSIGGIYMWVDYFGYEYAICHDTLFIRGGEEDHLQNTAFAVPVGALDLKESIPLLGAYCRQHGQPLILSAVPEPAAQTIAGLYGCPVTELPDWGDYLYRASDLATLVGHRFNKKRNRVNKFKSTYPDFQYEPVTAQNLPELKAFFDRYMQAYHKDSELFAYEESKVAQVLREYDRLPFEGGLLRVGGEIAAFSVGEVVNDTLIVHIEKARKDIVGAYEAINYFYSAQMAETHPEVQYINREDDAGDPGLREAKLSYNPETILKKYNIPLDNFLQ
ncbi:hypothetical protein BARVI_11165 [Barnesiella viscericola DSM 18177]|uniref:Phosphatidylglycerol lysyltransferase C-terminal domain-containing protein n=2 Tax=Barnesiella viscericola TaxID=397865 RepID=W0EVX7_9BACT|nr:hypothetical protein BARVI_11165 [Barnesiella viscericola DSM 18177]